MLKVDCSRTVFETINSASNPSDKLCPPSNVAATEYASNGLGPIGDTAINGVPPHSGGTFISSQSALLAFKGERLGHNGNSKNT